MLSLKFLPYSSIAPIKPMQQRRILRYVLTFFICPCDADDKEDVDGETDGVSANNIKTLNWGNFLQGIKR